MDNQRDTGGPLFLRFSNRAPPWRCHPTQGAPGGSAFRHWDWIRPPSLTHHPRPSDHAQNHETLGLEPLFWGAKACWNHKEILSPEVTGGTSRGGFRRWPGHTQHGVSVIQCPRQRFPSFKWLHISFSAYSGKHESAGHRSPAGPPRRLGAYFHPPTLSLSPCDTVPGRHWALPVLR